MYKVSQNMIRRTSRSTMRAQNTLGIIQLDLDSKKKVRSENLETYDKYYEGKQYCHLRGWSEAEGCKSEYIPIKQRAPKLNYRLPKIVCDRVASKLVGHEVFPKLKVEGMPEEEAFFKAVIKETLFKAKMMEPIKRMLAAGSVFVRFYLSGGAMQIEWHASKVCFPEFQPNGQLESVRIQYVYHDKDDLDENGAPKQKWYRMDLNTMEEVLYDNPEYKNDEEPVFQVVDTVEHGLGFVQGEWLKTSDLDKDNPDGFSLIEPMMDFTDDLNYSLSQSSNAIAYNQDPQLLLSGMTSDEVEDLIRSSSKSWNIGREGQAQFLESNLTGVERAQDNRDRLIKLAQDVSRVVILDPEKVVGHAQSGKAMEVLHGPMVDLVNEIRPFLETKLKSLILKMSLAILIMNKQGIEVPLEIPMGWVPKTIAFELIWPPVFKKTMEDIQKKVQVAVSAAGANIISRETALEWVSEEFGIEDIELEKQKIAAQPVINPFGGF